MMRVLRWTLIAACLQAAGAHGAEVFALSHELWDRPRTGRALLDQAGVKQAMKAYVAQPGSRLVVHHGPGAESLARAEELRTWLMALAVDAPRISLVSDAGTREPLKIEVMK